MTEEIYRTLLLNSADAVIVTDKAGLITTVNPSFTRLIGAEEKDLLGQPLSSYIDLSNPDDNGHSRHPAMVVEQHPEDELEPKPVTVLTAQKTCSTESSSRAWVCRKT